MGGSVLLRLAAPCLLVAAACAPAAPAPQGTPAAGGSPAATVSSGGSAAPARPAVVFTLVADGTEARYRVNETLATQVVADAVGSTKAVTGKVAFTETGQVVPEESTITVDVRTLQSDRNSRDNYLRRNTLQSDQFPQVTFVPREVRGLRFPLPASGTVSFELAGDLTVKTVTKPVTWQVNANLAGQEATGSATTSFTFADMGLEKPSVLAVLSVADDIRLELDFKVARATS